MSIQNFDKLNVLSYDTYFGEMGLSNKKTKDRLRLADHIEDAMLFLYALMMFTDDINYVKNAFYAELINGIEDADAYVISLVSEMSDKIVETTFKHRNDFSGKNTDSNSPVYGTERTYSHSSDVEKVTVKPEEKTDLSDTSKTSGKKENYFLSVERAKRVSADLSNTIRNHVDNVEAIVTGKTLKTWHTILDGRERETHFDADGQTIPIEQPFSVGDSLMMFPKDRSLGASDNEIVNCRCTCTYK